MQNLNLVVTDPNTFNEFLEKINKVYEILIAEKSKPDMVYSNKQACLYLNVCNKTMQNYRDSGQIRFIQEKRKISYEQQDLDDFKARNKKQLFSKDLKQINF